MICKLAVIEAKSLERLEKVKLVVDKEEEGAENSLNQDIEENSSKSRNFIPLLLKFVSQIPSSKITNATFQLQEIDFENEFIPFISSAFVWKNQGEANTVVTIITKVLKFEADYIFDSNFENSEFIKTNFTVSQHIQQAS